MSWIDTIAYEDATGELKKLYDRVKGPDNNVDNILLTHSLRPHSLLGHMTLYKNVLHHANNTVPKWFLETIGVYVSHLNRCDYCVDHHLEGLKKLLKDQREFERIELHLRSGSMLDCFEVKYKVALEYAKRLTLEPSALSAAAVSDLRQKGWSDGELLEINQVVAYFNYANRTVLGLGTVTDGDILGLSPNDSADEKNWSHK